LARRERFKQNFGRIAETFNIQRSTPNIEERMRIESPSDLHVECWALNVLARSSATVVYELLQKAMPLLAGELPPYGELKKMGP